MAKTARRSKTRKARKQTVAKRSRPRSQQKATRTVKQTKKLRVARKAAPQRQAQVVQMAPLRPEVEIGTVHHYYTHLGVCVLDVTDKDVAVGDTLKFVGTTTSFSQKVTSMQFNGQPLQRAVAGQSIGLKVDQRVREKDRVYKVEQ